MQERSEVFRLEASDDALGQKLLRVRQLTETLAAPLSDADAAVQSMEDASPAKWHLAHTTWFFEIVVLKQYLAGYQLFDDRFPYLFNSYYETLGSRHPRARRGMLTRPSLAEVLLYRAHVNAGLERLLETDLAPEVEALLDLGINHEQQHQELLMTDILHLFYQNPLTPAYKASEPLGVGRDPAVELSFLSFDGGVHDFGHAGTSFAFDCEGPRHRRLVEPFRLANRAVTNGEWIEFIEAGGYRTATLWLSDGWATVNREGWTAPLYWERREDRWWAMSLRGMQPVDLQAPVSHVSYFEADAYASFAGKRLPTEFEWELASLTVPIEGTALDDGRLRPAPTREGSGLRQMFGDVWEWTQSPFSPYPRFRPSEGPVGEYNGKFMNGQYVLRGGSCVTPSGHLRRTYRNFFQPEKRWQFSGVRLAEDMT